jgi:cytoskeletal protein CcmA (bactofilin family)
MFPNFNKSGTQLNGASISSSRTPPKIGLPPGDRVISIIGPDLTIDGDLISRGELRIDGEVQGNIEGTRVVIGEHAQITGGVSAEDIIVLGHVMGTVRGLRVSLQSTCHVEGDVYHQALVMEQGAFFEGKSTRSNDPLTIAAGPIGAALSTDAAHVGEIGP